MKAVLILLAALAAEPAAGEVPTKKIEPHSKEAYAKHIAGLKKKVPARGFTVIIQKPFVVIGDESPAVVKTRAERTVKWAVERLKKSYFKKDPDEILDVWLFKDKASYEKHAAYYDAIYAAQGKDYQESLLQ